MCGICGVKIGGEKLQLPIYQLIKGMNEQIVHRGPDHQGYYVNKEENLALGNSRLSIQDLSAAGNQPMTSKSNRFVVVLNGEIYNHLDLRLELKNSFNYDAWKGLSDTETICVLLDFYSIQEVVRKLNGMFSFVVWDKQEKKLYLLRDRTGEKPLYYYLNKKKKLFAFSSELKSFIKFKNSIFNLELNKNAIKLFLKLKSVPSPISIFENIKKLDPATILEFCENDFNLKYTKYWVFENFLRNTKPKINYTDSKNLLKIKIKKAVSSQLLSDRPVGCFLSGGIDSSLITSIMQNLSKQKIKTFSIGFDNNNYNEASSAKKIANYLLTDHYEYYFKEKDALNIIPDLPKIYDEPFADSSQLPTILLSRFAKKQVTVALSGDGGDELFGGYNRYLFFKKYWTLISKLPLKLRKLIHKCLNSIPIKYLKIFESFFYKNSKKPFEFISSFYKFVEVFSKTNAEEIYHYLISDWDNNDNFFKVKISEICIFQNYKKLNDIENIMINDFLNYLPNDIMTKVDRASMSTSLEARMPFMDRDLVEFAFEMNIDHKMKNNETKFILKDILKDYLPFELFNRPKKGFSIPVDDWIRGPLKNWSLSYLNSKYIREEDCFNIDILDKIVDEHFAYKKNHGQKLWNLIILAQWREYYKF